MHEDMEAIYGIVGSLTSRENRENRQFNIRGTDEGCVLDGVRDGKCLGRVNE
jgi:hypothetical protein